MFYEKMYCAAAKVKDNKVTHNTKLLGDRTL